jgi:hypothetical protein
MHCIMGWDEDLSFKESSCFNFQGLQNEWSSNILPFANVCNVDSKDPNYYRKQDFAILVDDDKQLFGEKITLIDM